MGDRGGGVYAKEKKKENGRRGKEEGEGGVRCSPEVLDNSSPSNT